ncbi:MAG TPA: hypothetical protein PKC74_04825, partial [Turneriella sp.]|nr:hypothetical protein [Turneriella sp.]
MVRLSSPTIFMNGRVFKHAHQKFCLARITLLSISLPLLTTALSADAAYDALKGQVKGLYSSFRATFAVTSSSGQIQTGKIMYQY